MSEYIDKYLTYKSGEQKESQFRVSPSSLSKFFDDSAKWHKEQVLKEDKFRGNTASVLGTLLHGRIQAYYDGVEPDKDSEYKYVSQYENNSDVDEWKVSDELDGVWKCWIDSKWSKLKPIAVEPYIQCDIDLSVCIGGSVDMVYKDGDNIVLVDWKTTSKKPNSMSQYRLQLYAYAWIAKQLGKPITKIQVVYIQRKTKTIEPRLWDEFVLDVSQEDLTWIEKQLYIVSTCYNLSQKDSSMTELLFRNNPASRFN